MKCESCGQQFDEPATACPNCHAPIPAIPSSGQHRPATWPGAVIANEEPVDTPTQGEAGGPPDDDPPPGWTPPWRTEEAPPPPPQQNPDKPAIGRTGNDTGMIVLTVIFVLSQRGFVDVFWMFYGWLFLIWFIDLFIIGIGKLSGRGGR